LLAGKLYVSLGCQLVHREKSLLIESVLTIGEFQVQLLVFLREFLNVPTIPSTGVVDVIAELFDIVLKAVILCQELLSLLGRWLLLSRRDDLWWWSPLQLSSALLLMLLPDTFHYFFVLSA